MQAQDIMNKNIISAAPDTTVDQLVKLMMKHHISALPIVDENGAISGLVSEGDLMRRVEGAQAPPKSWWLSLFAGNKYSVTDFIKLRGRHAREIMTRKVITVTPDTPVGQIARLLERERIKRVPVVENSNLVGIVSRANLLHALATTTFKLPSNAGDREKRNTVLGALAEVPGLVPSHINIIVHGNRINVWGIVDTDAEETAAKMAIENIEGIGEVTVYLGRIPRNPYAF